MLERKDVANHVAATIDAGSHAALTEYPFRWHLGASVIGRDCLRELVYHFRWMYAPKHPAKLKRLFNRGHQEEDRVTQWLRFGGWNVEALDPLTNDQFNVGAVNGHFGGSFDARLTHDRYNHLLMLGEFKTHNDASFNKLRKEGVYKSKFEHYIQMNIYMELAATDYCIYVAVNKDNDDIFTDLVQRNSKVAQKYIDRARMVVQSTSLPPRISETPAYFKCKFCDYAPICHGNEPAALNCRSCRHAAAIANKEWFCTRFNVTLSKEAVKRGCEVWAQFE